MRIAIVTESFPPDVNGVANSVVRVAEHLVRRSHAPMVVAPSPSVTTRGVTGAHAYPEPSNRAPTATAKAVWMATRGTRWLLDRSTDLVPYLARMALAEWWFEVRGAAHRLDEGVQAEVAAALLGLDESALA
jgi:hypothetical protein